MYYKDEDNDETGDKQESEPSSDPYHDGNSYTFKGVGFFKMGQLTDGPAFFL